MIPSLRRDVFVFVPFCVISSLRPFSFGLFCSFHLWCADYHGINSGEFVHATALLIHWHRRPDSNDELDVIHATLEVVGDVPGRPRIW